MVDTTKAMESDFLNVDMVRESPSKKCVILSEGEYVPAEYQGKKYEKFNIDIDLDGKHKIWSPTKDAVKNLSAEYGKDSKAWIGKAVALRITKNNGKDTINALPLLV